ncbi:ABC transporter ATP-binding protein [Veillonella sp. AF13-2]|uniref:ABC transporter ATP-binding protein n=1 Tax=Veillonella sp. AF13-2 TaxID=2293250 RepID=UPI000EC2F533|nr:ABC transporter ATP-binding protein [Veillonella sp. AF13-2]RJV49431.1 ABC transporter ATP-binding protein [Veillonella sp. AF13-2]
MNIQTDNIQVSFGSKTILQDISLDIRDKEFVGIIGPNGSGKSTFLKCLYRVLQPNHGKIFFDGTEMSSLSHRDTALKMAVVAQHSTVNFDFSVLEMVLMGRSPYKGLLDRDQIDDYEIARHALSQVGLSDFESRNFNTLSGGEQQRVILARALAQRTECLVLDEPTNHLDIKYQLELMTIVKRLDATVVSAIHDLNLASMYCDRLIALKDGSVVCTGTPHEVLTEETIRHIYGVSATVQTLPNGRLNIIYNME